MTTRYPTTFILFSLIAGAVCLRLGFWQVDRLTTRRAASAAALARRSLPALDPRQMGDTAQDRDVVASGRYDYDREIVLRGRARNGVPGVEVVTPLVLPGADTAVLVLRGYVPSADAISYDLALHREGDSATVRGVAWPVPIDSARAVPSERNGQVTWHRLDLGTVRDSLPYAVFPLFIIADSPATVSPQPTRSAAPALDDGPHLNYAIQWFAFATIAFGGAAALWWNRRREAASGP